MVFDLDCIFDIFPLRSLLNRRGLLGFSSPLLVVLLLGTDEVRAPFFEFGVIIGIIAVF